VGLNFPEMQTQESVRIVNGIVGIAPVFQYLDGWYRVRERKLFYRRQIL
jgi:hypothetical protein